MPAGTGNWNKTGHGNRQAAQPVLFTGSYGGSAGPVPGNVVDPSTGDWRSTFCPARAVSAITLSKGPPTARVLIYLKPFCNALR